MDSCINLIDSTPRGPFDSTETFRFSLTSTKKSLVLIEVKPEPFDSQYELNIAPNLEALEDPSKLT